MIKLIASDLDGTLLYGRDNTVSEEMFEMIREMKKKGIIFAAASGRPYSSIRHLFREVADDIIYICESGSLVIDKGEVIFSKCIPWLALTKMLSPSLMWEDKASISSSLVLKYTPSL